MEKKRKYNKRIMEVEPNGLDAVFDGMAGEHFKRGFSILKRGGTLVGYANPISYTGMVKVLSQVVHGRGSRDSVGPQRPSSDLQ